MIKVNCLKRDIDAEIVCHFDHWFAHVALNADRLQDLTKEVYDDFVDPFAYGEWTIASFLAAGAACAGYIPLCEYEVHKKKIPGQEPSSRQGRADLWLTTQNSIYYSFEIKVVRDDLRAKSAMELALNDIRRISKVECHHRFAMVVVANSTNKSSIVFEDADIHYSVIIGRNQHQILLKKSEFR